MVINRHYKKLMDLQRLRNGICNVCCCWGKAAAVAAGVGNRYVPKELATHTYTLDMSVGNISSVYKHVANHALQTKAECQTARLTSFVKPCLFRLAAVAEPLPYIISLTNIWQQFYNRCEGKKLKKNIKEGNGCLQEKQKSTNI